MNKKRVPFGTLNFGGGGGIRTLVLFILTINDYTFRITFSNVPKYSVCSSPS